jgi:hypothetical protein
MLTFQYKGLYTAKELFYSIAIIKTTRQLSLLVVIKDSLVYNFAVARKLHTITYSFCAAAIFYAISNPKVQPTVKSAGMSFIIVLLHCQF